MAANLTWSCYRPVVAVRPPTASAAVGLSRQKCSLSMDAYRPPKKRSASPQPKWRTAARPGGADGKFSSDLASNRT